MWLGFIVRGSHISQFDGQISDKDELVTLNQIEETILVLWFFLVWRIRMDEYDLWLKLLKLFVWYFT